MAHYDLLVVGTGPAGQKAAIQAAKLGKKVGIIGVGGLGHFGVIFAKALGADKVVGISRKADKKDDVLKMGADEYVATSEDKDVSVHLYMSTVEGC